MNSYGKNFHGTVVYIRTNNCSISFIFLTTLAIPISTLLRMTDVRDWSVWELIEEANTSGSFVHEIIQGESWAHTLSAVELVLAVGVFLTEFTSASRKLDKAQQALVGLVLETNKSRVVRMGVISRQLVHITNQHRLRNHRMVLVRRIKKLRHRNTTRRRNACQDWKNFEIVLVTLSIIRRGARENEFGVQFDFWSIFVA